MCPSYTEKCGCPKVTKKNIQQKTSSTGDQYTTKHETSFAHEVIMEYATFEFLFKVYTNPSDFQLGEVIL